jgi:hypothetical protein
MGKSKLTWKFYSARRRGLSVEKYIETHKIKSLDDLRESLRQKDVQLPDPELLKDLFKPEWTGKYPLKKEDELADNVKVKKSQESGVSSAKTKKATKEKKRSKARVEKKSTYLQAAYETGSQDDDPNVEPGA